MNLINLENVSKSYTDSKLLDQINFSMDDQEKVGIIGVNGTGKSTLLKLILGVEQPDEGKITKANGIVIRYLAQQPSFDPEATVLECVMKDNQNAHNEWSLESEAKTMLATLGVTGYDEKVKYLSGGQKKRIALANTLLSSAELLILDEPTNHLDPEMADWLEEYLKNRKGALIMVTHDRYFLDSVSNRIVEIDHAKVYSYQTNYSGFLKLKAERAEMAAASERKRQSILRNEIEWMMRGARARSTKQKAHIQRYEALSAIKAPKQESELEISSISTRMGRTTVEIDHVSKAYGDKKLIQDFSYIFLKKDRIGFIGKNGCGKTTLMKMIYGLEKPDAGEIVIGQTIKIGYYAQEFLNDKSQGLAYMDPDIRVIDYIRNTAEFVQTPEGSVSASVMLDRFLFPPEKQYALLGKLSGGEKRRLNLLRVIMEAPNVLILDEPTNDLDIETLTILEDYLDSFDGIVITVSHDRYFLDRVVRRIFAFEEDGIKQYEGGYTDYQAKRIELGLDAVSGVAEISKAEAPKAEKAVKTHEEKVKFTYAEQKEYSTIEDDIAKLEEKIEKLDRDIALAATDYGKLHKLSLEREKVAAKLDEKMERWMYLQDLAEQIESYKQLQGKK